MLILPSRHLHLWLADQQALDDDELEQFRDWLSDDEREKLDGYQRPEMARRYLVTRAVARHCLSQYSDSTAPKDWTFGVDDNGKPKLVDPGMDFQFNLSHSGRWVVMAVAEATPVGVDVERLSRKTQHSLLDIAQHYFHPDEIAQLESLEAEDRRLYFYQLWTLKEAWLKGRGTGITTGLDKVCIALEADGAVTLSLDPSLEDSADHWQFHHYHLGEDYYLSAALNQRPAQAANPHIYKALLDDKPVPLEVEARHIRLA